MKNNNTVDTAQKGQTTTKDKTPTGKIVLMKDTENRRKAREEQYRNFRIAALRRRCKRMNMNEEQIQELIEKLKAQLDSPKLYRILIMFNPNDGAMLKESLKKEKIDYLFGGDSYMYIDGDQNILAKIREIAPSSTKIHPYAKKMESVIPAQVKVKEKKPTNNTKEVKLVAKNARKAKNVTKCASRKKVRGKAWAKQTLKELHLKHKKERKAKIAQMAIKTSSKGSKMALMAALEGCL